MSDKDSYQFMKPAPFATIALQDDVSIFSEFTGATRFPVDPPGQLRGAEQKPIDGLGGAPVQRSGTPDLDDASTAAPEAFRKLVPYSDPPQESRPEWQPIGDQDARLPRAGMQGDSSTPAAEAFKVVPSAPPQQFHNTENQPNGDEAPDDWPGSQDDRNAPAPKAFQLVPTAPSEEEVAPGYAAKEDSKVRASNEDHHGDGLDIDTQDEESAIEVLGDTREIQTNDIESNNDNAESQDEENAIEVVTDTTEIQTKDIEAQRGLEESPGQMWEEEWKYSLMLSIGIIMATAIIWLSVIVL